VSFTAGDVVILKLH